jgi:hypothetical protein
MTAPLHGLIAEFTDHEALARAVEATRRAGYRRVAVYAPFPMRDLARSLGYRTAILPWLALGAGAFGAALQYYLQYWMNAVDYPINVGGRPLHAWPAFIPATIIVAIMWAGAATLIGTLLILRLPRLHHPVFAVPGFERASQDRFFLVVRADDPLFDAAATGRFLAALEPRRVQEVDA